MIYTPIKFKDYNERKEYLFNEYSHILGEMVIASLVGRGFLTAPCSTRYHGNYEGGLFDHSVNVANILHELSVRNALIWKDGTVGESPKRVGILHDLCKIDQYKIMLNETGDPIVNDKGFVYEWNDAPVIKGHGTKSVIYAQSIGARLSQEERACIIYHMGAFTEREEWRDYTRAVEVYPNVLWTHQADMIATHILEV